MQFYMWQPLAQSADPRVVKAFHGGVVLEFLKDRWFFRRTGIYLWYRGPDMSPLIQLQKDPEPIVCSEFDGPVLRSKAAAYLDKQGIQPRDFVIAGLQKVHHDMKDGLRRSLERFVVRYFEGGALGTLAQDI